ncbi:hypothetical protein ACS5PK_22270 [Roseateles sp. DB2]|uniref:hypothetical protein n=1 Tax=Roseateles sp. DB2 TaxID=3453717 RepID=UPI003EEED09D
MSNTMNDSSPFPPDLGRRLGDLSDLPEALRKQIAIAKLDDLEEKIVKTLRDRFGGIANMDELIVGLYRDHAYITEDRRKLANKLYRMQQGGLVESVPKRKGVYRLKESAAEM